MTLNEQDSLQRFVFVNAPVRGEMVRLHRSYLAILERHPYPLPIRKILGETLTAATLLSAILKFSGSLTMQIQAKGPLKLLVAQANHQNQIRGLAQWEEEITDTSFDKLMPEGQMIITIDPGEKKERYQGIVELKGDSLAETLENYFAKSEQLPTFLYLIANEQMAAGMLLQALPDTYDRDPGIAWQHLTRLSQTLTANEMLNLSNQEILHRLFHEEDLQLFDPQPVAFYCSCTRERMERAILTMGREEALELIAEKKVLTVTCEFCNRHHDFDIVDVTQLFVGTE